MTNKREKRYVINRLKVRKNLFRSPDIWFRYIWYSKTIMNFKY